MSWLVERYRYLIYTVERVMFAPFCCLNNIHCIVMSRWKGNQFYHLPFGPVAPNFCSQATRKYSLFFFFPMEIVWWAPWISQVQSTGLRGLACYSPKAISAIVYWFFCNLNFPKKTSLACHGIHSLKYQNPVPQAIRHYFFARCLLM